MSGIPITTGILEEFRSSLRHKQNLREKVKKITNVKCSIHFSGQNFVRHVNDSGILEEFQSRLVSPVRIFQEFLEPVEDGSGYYLFVCQNQKNEVNISEADLHQLGYGIFPTVEFFVITLGALIFF